MSAPGSAAGANGAAFTVEVFRYALAEVKEEILKKLSRISARVDELHARFEQRQEEADAGPAKKKRNRKPVPLTVPDTDLYRTVVDHVKKKDDITPEEWDVVFRAFGHRAYQVKGRIKARFAELVRANYNPNAPVPVPVVSIVPGSSGVPPAIVPGASSAARMWDAPMAGDAVDVDDDDDDESDGSEEATRRSRANKGPKRQRRK